MKNIYEAAVGVKNQNYYLTKFDSFDQKGSGLKASFNLAAILFGLAWALYRKMYVWFFVLFGIAILSNILGKSGSTTLSLVVILLPWLAFAIFANSLYYNSIKKQIAEAQLTHKDEPSLLEFIRSKGGVHGWVIWVCIAIPLIPIISAIVLPSLMKR